MKEMNMNYTESASYIQSRVVGEMPEIAIVLGSGLAKLADQIEDAQVIPYQDIPHFRTSTATGHKSNLIVGVLGGVRVIAMQGRFHYYEGYTMEEVTYPVRVFAKLGVKTYVVSNAAGGMNPDFRVGDLMMITDHISFMPNPLIGPNKEAFGTRFPDMTTVYTPALQRVAREKAEMLGIELKEGVYLAETGPTYETPAEYRMFHMLGADAVGMSTVPEVIVARHCGMDVFGISVITNCSKDLGEDCLNDGEDVVKAANMAADKMSTLIKEIIKTI